MVLAHTVIAKVGETLKRVRCNTCKAEHAYRAEPGKRAPRAKAGTATKQPKSRALPSNYSTLMGNRTEFEASDYSPKLALTAGEVVRHPRFGVGVVSLLKGRDKAEVVFPDATRVLIHGRA